MSENTTTDVVDTEVVETEETTEPTTTTEGDALGHEQPAVPGVDDEAGDEAQDTDDAEDAPDDAGDDAEDEDAAGASASEGSGRSRRQVLEREGEVAADFLETLLDICDLDGDIDVDIDGDRAAVSVVDSEDGRVPRRLVGDGGKVLDALQELTRLAVQSATGERSRLMLDVAGHRAERREALVELAATAIAEVKESGERKPLAPMTAFERKVVHDEVLAAGLVSESEGAEPRRFVVILPA
ncbi:protein jag [Oryzobacter terrae]|uniref:Jag family protein n=1 Tax=Oryzobacter terrae TaxID=1620385 RepID=UPI00366C5CDA